MFNYLSLIFTNVPDSSPKSKLDRSDDLIFCLHRSDGYDEEWLKMYTETQVLLMVIRLHIFLWMFERDINYPKD